MTRQKKTSSLLHRSTTGTSSPSSPYSLSSQNQLTNLTQGGCIIDWVNDEDHNGTSNDISTVLNMDDESNDGDNDDGINDNDDENRSILNSSTYSRLNSNPRSNSNSPTNSSFADNSPFGAQPLTQEIYEQDEQQHQQEMRLQKQQKVEKMRQIIQEKVENEVEGIFAILDQEKNKSVDLQQQQQDQSLSSIAGESVGGDSSAKCKHSCSSSTTDNGDQDDDVTVRADNLSTSSMYSVLKRRQRRIDLEQRKKMRSMEKKRKKATMTKDASRVIGYNKSSPAIDASSAKKKNNCQNNSPIKDGNEDDKGFGSSFADLLYDLDEHDHDSDQKDDNLDENIDENIDDIVDENIPSPVSKLNFDNNNNSLPSISNQQLPQQLPQQPAQQLPQQQQLQSLDKQISQDTKNCNQNNNKSNEENEFDDPFSGGIDFNDEVFAAVDAAIHARTISQQEQQQQNPNVNVNNNITTSTCTNKINQDSNNNKHIESRPTTVQTSDTSCHIAQNTCNEMSNAQINSIETVDLSSSKPSLSASHPPQSSLPETTTADNNDDDDFGDFPEMDFDEWDKMVENQQKLNQAGPSVITPAISHSSTYSTSLSSVSSKSFPLSSPPNIDDGRPKFMSWTRYVINSVYDDTYIFQKTLGVTVWTRIRENNFTEYDEKIDNIQQQQQINVDGNIFLQGEWYSTRCEVGDTIHICSISGQYKTDITALPLHLHSENKDDLVLVHHPDELITPTSISESVNCPRLAVLKMRLGSSAMTNKSAVIGQVRHSLFEKCLTSQNFTKEFIYTHAPRLVRDHAEQLIGCGIYDENETVREVVKIQPQLEQFARAYVSFGTSEKHTNSDTGLEGHGLSSSIKFTAKNIVDTEEGTISVELGLKGFVDATVEAKTRGCQIQRTVYGNEKPTPAQTALMGIELKTGHNQKPHVNHVAQLSLYTLTLRSRHGTVNGYDRDNRNSTNSLVINGASKGGMLLYLNHESLNAVHVSPETHEIKSLIGQRNNLATDKRVAARPRGITIHYERSDSNREQMRDSDVKKSIYVHPATSTELPELRYSSFSCDRCFNNRHCMLVAATSHIDGNQKKSFGPLLQHFTGHLNEVELQYFRDWDRLIDLEEHTSHNDITKAWLMNPVERERTTGKCISSLTVSASGNQENPLFGQHKGEEDSFSIKLERSIDSELTTPLDKLKFEIGSRVMLSSNGTSLYQSDQKQDFGILRGAVENMESNFVIIRVGEADVKRINRIMSAAPQGTLFRLEKEDFTTGTGILRQNLINLFNSDIAPYVGKLGLTKELLSSIHERTKLRLPWLRRSIIHLVAPKFDKQVSRNIFHTSKMSYIQGCSMRSLALEFQNLNADQKAAVFKVISAQDYALIQGFPGTGKTSTIAFLVRLLAARGKRILISSYTHSAVDNLLLKLVEDGVGKQSNSDLVRIGAKSSCHPALQKFLAPEIACNLDQLEGKDKLSSKPSSSNLHRVVSSAKIIGATALTVPKTPLLLGEHFDIVIVDEAGQISQPALLGSLMAADSFVLVGDHQQLPPLVQSEAAEKAGHGISMLKRLADAFPDAVAQLTLQYRMHEDICLLSNLVVYEGKLKCATDEVRSKRLLLPSYPRSLRNICNKSSIGLGWLLPVLNPGKAVVFVNTDNIGSNSDASFHGLEISQGHSRRGGGTVNEVEAKLTRLIVHGLQTCGLDSKSIGVICPYRSQLKLLDSDPFLSSGKKAGLEVSTIDRYQGRDKETIVLSLIRSNEMGRTGKLLEDFRRMNVAFSRAKRKLIIIGSYRTLSMGSQVLQPVLREIMERSWIENLPKNAIEIYKEPVCNFGQ